MASKIEDAVVLARLDGAIIIHTKQVLAVFPNGTTKVLQAFSWNAKEDEFKAPKRKVVKKTVEPFKVEQTEEEI